MDTWIWFLVGFTVFLLYKSRLIKLQWFLSVRRILSDGQTNAGPVQGMLGTSGNAKTVSTHDGLNTHFAEDSGAGLSSSTFDLLSANRGDNREGLDDNSKKEIQKLIREKGIDFDQARLLSLRRKFMANGIAPDGMPLDPKAFTFAHND